MGPFAAPFAAEPAAMNVFADDTNEGLEEGYSGSSSDDDFDFNDDYNTGEGDNALIGGGDSDTNDDANYYLGSNAGGSDSFVASQPDQNDNVGYRSSNEDEDNENTATAITDSSVVKKLK